MVNTEVLREHLNRSGYKLRYVAARIGLTYQGFLQKLKGKTEFLISEAQLLSEILGLSGAEKEAIFLGAMSIIN
jgi:hypothetical protein